MPVLKGVKIKRQPTRSGPLWLGPEDPGPRGGITFSMLSRFLTCRERFRVNFVVGLRPAERFRAAVEYGNMWHACEEALAGRKDWLPALAAYGRELVARYPQDQDEIQKWYNVCKTQFPVYVDFWSKHPDVKSRRPLLQEESFHVSYRLPSGRIVYLRGKWDSVDLIGKNEVYLQENKTKSQIDVVELSRQLTFDMQTMMYLVALYKSGCCEDEKMDGHYWSSEGHYASDVPPYRIAGVRYNVVRRDCPIRQHKPSKSNPQGETKEEFFERLKRDYFEAEPETWFHRLKATVTQGDVDRFRRETLDPILEQLCDWYEYTTTGKATWASAGSAIHYRHPFGVVNTIDEYGATDLDEYLTSGSTVGLVETKLFPELGTSN